MKLILIPFAATCAEVFTHPIDFVKTQIQIKDCNVAKSCKDTLKKHGIGGFYRSIVPAVGRHLIYSTGRISIYERLKKDDDIFAVKALNGFLAGGVAQFLASPMDLIKIQIQNDPTRGVMQVFRSVLRAHGVIGFFRGWQPNVLRACLVNFGELTTYDLAKSNLLKTFNMPDSSITHFCSSAISGLVSTFISTPADVIKSNYMSDPSKHGNSIVKCVKNIFQERGLFFFWKGFGLNWIRLGPWQMIFWLSYEKLSLMANLKTF